MSAFLHALPHMVHTHKPHLQSGVIWCAWGEACIPFWGRPWEKGDHADCMSLEQPHQYQHQTNAMYVHGCFGYKIRERAWSRYVADSETFQILSSNHLETVRCTLVLSWCILGVWHIKGTAKGVSYFRIQFLPNNNHFQSQVTHFTHWWNGSGMFAEGWQGLT